MSSSGSLRWLDRGGGRLSDVSLIGVAHHAGWQRRSEFAGFARFGFAKSQHRFVYGVRLVLLSDDRGLPLGYTLVPANEKEYEPLADLLTGTPTEVVIATRASGDAPTASVSPPVAQRCSPRARPAPPPTSDANA